jgi:hypothetical protein
MSIEQALRILREHGAILCYTKRGLDVWAPGCDLPASQRYEVLSHRRQLRAMMRQGDIRVCPNRDLHRKYWRYAGGTVRCEICERIDAA